VLWTLAASTLFRQRASDAPHPIVATLLIIAFGALLAAAIATRRRATLATA
jgi:hypothetical protein